MVKNLKWFVDQVIAKMQGKWEASRQKLGIFLQDIAHTFWLAEDENVYQYWQDNLYIKKDPDTEIDNIRLRLIEIERDPDYLSRLKTQYLSQCKELIRDEESNDLVVKGLLISIQTNLDPNSTEQPQRAKSHAPAQHSRNKRRNAHIQSLLLQLQHLEDDLQIF